MPFQALQTTTRMVAASAALLCLVLPAAASESLFITCDNGLRCVRAPCPSWDTVALPSGKRFARTAMDFGGLSEQDKAQLHEGDRLYHGKLVLAGTVSREAGGDLKTSRATIRGSRIVRAATAGESALCRQR